MAKLTQKEKNAKPRSAYAIPPTPAAKKRGQPGSYLVSDRAHAANAKSRASHQGGAVKKKVFAAVARRFPGLGKKSTTLGQMYGRHAA